MISTRPDHSLIPRICEKSPSKNPVIFAFCAIIGHPRLSLNVPQGPPDRDLHDGEPDTGYGLGPLGGISPTEPG